MRNLDTLPNSWVEMAKTCENAMQTAREAIAGWTAVNEQIRKCIETEVIQASIDAGVLPDAAA